MMCDYSLEAYRTRPARQGEEYESHRFVSGSIGFIAPGDATTAVCMASDIRLALKDIPSSVQTSCSVTASEKVTFVRLDNGPYHDGVRFDNGAEITLQRLGTGVKASVLDALLTPRRMRVSADTI